MNGMEICIVVLFIVVLSLIIALALTLDRIDKLNKKIIELDGTLNSRDDNFDNALDLIDRSIDIINNNHSFVENTYKAVKEITSKAIESMETIAIEAGKTAKMCSEMDEFCRSTAKKNELICDEIRAFSEALEHINNVMRMNGLLEFKRNPELCSVNVSKNYPGDTDVENG